MESGASLLQIWLVVCVYDAMTNEIRHPCHCAVPFGFSSDPESCLGEALARTETGPGADSLFSQRVSATLSMTEHRRI